jgi:hypothetical protein
MRTAIKHLTRYIATPAVSKHRIMVWAAKNVLCNQGTLVFARDDDYFFGVLQSRVHDVWALKQGTSLEDRPRYTPTTTFETFPFPWAPNCEPKEDQSKERIGSAARELLRKREAWLTPVGGSAEQLKGRTLTNLYNLSPGWLDDAHRELNEAVLAAYGWKSSLSDDEILARLLDLNGERFAKQRDHTKVDVLYQTAEPDSKPKSPASVRPASDMKRILSH